MSKLVDPDTEVVAYGGGFVAGWMDETGHRQNGSIRRTYDEAAADVPREALRREVAYWRADAAASDTRGRQS